MQNRYSKKVPPHCLLLLGPRYALLREEFRILRDQVKVRSGEVKNFLVFFGGVDTYNYTLKTIEALSEISTNLHVDVVIGPQHQFKKQIEEACAKYGYVCHLQAPYIAKLIAEADLAIGAGGTSIWERCCLGLPTISLCMAKNQFKQIHDASEMGVLFAPKMDNNLIESIRTHIKSLLQNVGLIKLISRKALNFVDGKGTLRVVSAIAYGNIELKKATHYDSRSVYEWRNNRRIRAVSKSSDIISWDDHEKWFNAVLADVSRCLLIGSIDNIQIGVVRFDLKGNSAEVSIYLVPEVGRTGQGKFLLLASENWLRVNHPEITRINANVLGENESSKFFFTSLSYRISMLNYQKDL
jgi:hypothetical protein